MTEYEHLLSKVKENIFQYFENDLSKFETFYQNLSHSNKKLFRHNFLYFQSHIENIKTTGAFSGPFIVIVFSVIESINKRKKFETDIKKIGSKNRQRIKHFFCNNLSKEEKINLILKFELSNDPDYKKFIKYSLPKAINGAELNKRKLKISEIDSIIDKIINILYIARNNFVHDAEFFYLGKKDYIILDAAIESIRKKDLRGKSRTRKKRHPFVIKLNNMDFTDILLKGFLRHFKYKDLPLAQIKLDDLEWAMD